MNRAVLAIRGTIALLLGCSVLITTMGKDRLATFIAVYFILAGIAAVRSARPPGADRRQRLRQIAGGLAILFAVAVLTRQLVDDAIPKSTAAALLGIGTIGLGILRLMGAFDEPGRPSPSARTRTRLPLTRLALGVVEVALGVTLVLGDFNRIWPVVAIWGIVSGTALLTDAARHRRAEVSPRTTGEPPE